MSLDTITRFLIVAMVATGCNMLELRPAVSKEREKKETSDGIHKTETHPQKIGRLRVISSGFISCDYKDITVSNVEYHSQPEDNDGYQYTWVANCGMKTIHCVSVVDVPGGGFETAVYCS